MLFVTLSIAALAGLSLASSPTTETPKTVTIRGTPRTLKYRNADGKVDYGFIRSEIARVQAKYAPAHAPAKSGSQNRSRARPRRAVATEPLQDSVQQGIDTLYYGPIKVGTPSQTIRMFVFSRIQMLVSFRRGGTEAVACYAPGLLESRDRFRYWISRSVPYRVKDRLGGFEH